MVTSSKNRQGDKETRRQVDSQSPYHLVILSSCLLVSLLLLLASCSSIRPIAKIGLIASFEGVERRSGYEALAAMRAAIADTPSTSIDLLPLALDDSLDPQRTAQKMLADPTLKAVIGPLVPATLALTLPDFAASEVRWITPFVVDPQGSFADPAMASAWATELIRGVVQSNSEERKGRLFLVGWTPGWPQLSEQQWSTITEIDTHLTGASTLIHDIIQGTVNDNDLIFWLGSPEEGAHFANELWQARPNFVLWSGPQGGDPLFSERLRVRGAFFWATWSNDQYEAWAAQHRPATPAAYLTYLATRSAILQLQSLPNVGSEMKWLVKCFHLNEDNTNVGVEKCR